MKIHNTRDRKPTGLIRLVSYVAALGMTFGVALSPPAHADAVVPPLVPENLLVSDGNEAFLVAHAFGTQDYVCLPSPTIGKVAWTLFTPRATLFDAGGEQNMTHYFSPNPSEGGTLRATWEDSADTSTVWGRAIASSSDPSFVTQGAIPWLLVEIVGALSGPTGGDAISHTTFIHRVSTGGGASPSSGCGLPTDIGKRAYVPYAADYVFYRSAN